MCFCLHFSISKTGSISDLVWYDFSIFFLKVHKVMVYLIHNSVFLKTNIHSLYPKLFYRYLGEFPSNE